jgi:DUF1680 family protein
MMVQGRDDIQRHGLPRSARFQGCPLGDAQAINRSARLSSFVQNEDSEAIQLFAPQWRDQCMTGDWYGEHAGKWLTAAASAWLNTGDAELADRVRKIVRFLVATQEQSGYLGTYSAKNPARFTNPQIEGIRTWDVWVHACMMMGLLTAAQVPGCEAALPAAAKIGDLLVANFLSTGCSLLAYGNHQGLSAAVVIEPLVRLSTAMGDSQYMNLAWKVLQDLEQSGIPFLSGDGSNRDVSELGTGKIYQICWILTGMVALQECAPELPILPHVIHYWKSICDAHLNPLGGPWGGIATHKEVFNSPGYFHPAGLVETCSVASWMSLNRELFLTTGNAKYLAEFERSLHNALLGAQNENGNDWIYFSFPNGRRNDTYHWACCKSSGAMALEQASAILATQMGDKISINLPVGGWVDLGDCTVQQDVSHTVTGISIRTAVESKVIGSAQIRIPEWGRLESLNVNGTELEISQRADGFVDVDISATESACIEWNVACTPLVKTYTDVLDHHGQEIVRTDYLYVSWGPFVYAFGLLDGHKQQETLRLPKLNPAKCVEIGSELPGGIPQLNLNLPARPSIAMEPYFSAGGRHNHAWRTTWIQVAWQ